MSSPTLVSVNPANDRVIKTYKAHTVQQTDKAINAAHKAFSSWKMSSWKERRALLLRIAAVLRSRKEALALLATREMGKPLVQSREEVEKCARTFEFFARETPAFLADEVIATDARKSYVSFRPLGVVLAVMPWNFPYWQVFRAMAPVLAAGNSMLLKHASNVSGCALAIEKVLKEAGAPAGLFRTLLIPSEQVAAVIARPEIVAVTFTGSTAAGRKVAATAAMHLKKQVLELGGSDAYIVLEDADLDLAVTTCYQARLVNTGQSCLAAKRFIVVRAVRKEFERKMLDLVRNTIYGDPLNPDHKLGPMARTDLRDELHEQVRKSIDAGARLLAGGVIPEQPGAFYPATLLTAVRKGMPAYDEELFGPVAVIIEARDEDEALAIANSSEYGLGGAVFSRNRKRAEHIAARLLDAGNCFVNAAVHSDPRMPFGGIKSSGYGRELSAYALREFVNIKSVFIQ